MRNHKSHPYFYRVYEGDILRANQSTLEGALHYMETGRVLVLPSRKYRKGDRVISWHGIKGTVTKTQTIINNVAPHHRVFVVMDDNPEMIRTLEGAEYNFHRA